MSKFYFPSGEIILSGEQKSCDYMLKRDNKPNILFENKDYKNNVPNEEIRNLLEILNIKKLMGFYYRKIVALLIK